VLPFTAAVFVPPGWDERYVTSFGFTLQDIFALGAEAMEGRLRAAGLDPGSMRLGLPFDLSPAERAHRGLTLRRAGYLGEPNGPVTPNPEATAMLFDGLRRQIDASVAPGAVIQWDFSDADPWHLRIDKGRPSTSPGRAERPDLTFHCRLADWVDIAAGRTEPWRTLLQRKVRLTGKPRMLIQAPRLFG
jgi:SCP-2 sterol transfer family